MCGDCTTVIHKDHNVTELSTVAEACRGEMSGTLQLVKGTLDDTIDTNKKKMEQVETSKKEAELAIKQAFGQLHEMLGEREKALLSELEAITLSKTTFLILQKEQLEKIQQESSPYIEVTSHILQTHTDSEVVAMGELIPTELKATLKKLESIPPTPNTFTDISVDVQTEGLVIELSKFGYICDTSPSPSSSTWTSTSVAKVGTRFDVKVESKTSLGKRYPHGGVKVQAEMRLKNHNGAVVYGEVEDHRDGTYTINLTPQTAGPHQLLITMDGQHVQNCPHDLDVKSAFQYLMECSPNKYVYCHRNPLCVAIHGNSDIYVGSRNDFISVYSNAGRLKNTISNTVNTRGVNPTGICIKGDDLYIADYNYGVHKLSLDGKKIFSVYVKSITAVIIGGQYNWIFAASERYNLKVHIYNHNGGLVFSIDGCDSGDGGFKGSISGLALDSQENLHVAASGSKAIKVFTKAGVYVRMYGEDLKCPSGIAIDREDYCVVSESESNCLSIFDPHGNKVNTIAMPEQCKPSGLAFSHRDLYIVSHTYDVVLQYNCIK